MAIVQYLNVEQRTPDTQYQDLLRKILREGEWFPNQMGVPAQTLFAQTLRFPLSNGAPIITERDIVTKNRLGRSIYTQALGEMTAFLNGAQTHNELTTYGCFWWKNWVSAAKCEKRGLLEGDLGPGSYGPAWTNFPTPTGGFNQLDALVAQIRENPHLRTHKITTWIPEFIFRAEGYAQRVVVVPCHGDVLVRINTDTGKMTLILTQRSADIPVGFPANLCAYTAFGLMLAELTGYELFEIIFTILDAHIYENQVEVARELSNQEPKKLPSLLLSSSPARGNLSEYRTEDFDVSDYYPSDLRMIIPTPI